MRTPTTRPFSWQAQFLLLSAIWGASFLFIKLGDEGLPPVQVASGRMLVGAVGLLAIALARRESLRLAWRDWFHVSVCALCFHTLPFVLFAWGETRTSSVLAGIWNATTPLFTLPLTLLFVRAEPAGRGRIAGVVLGFAGVLVVLGPWHRLSGGALAGNLACIAAACCYGIGFVYARSFVSGKSYSTLTLTTGQVVSGAVQLLAVTLAVSSLPSHVPPAKSWLAILALGLLGTTVAYLLNFAVIRAAGITVASTVTYVIPIFSTALGVFALGESLGWNQPAGAVVILLAAALVQGRVRLRRRRLSLETA